MASKEGSFQIYRERKIEVLLGDVQREAAAPATGVVDEYVKLSKMLTGFLDGARDLLEISDIHLQPEGFLPQGIEFPHQIVSGRDVAQSEGDIRTSMSERESDGATQASRGAGDQGDLSSEAEIREIIHRSSFRSGSLAYPGHLQIPPRSQRYSEETMRATASLKVARPSR